MRSVSGLLILTLPLALGGCLAKAALDVATAPVKVVGKAVEWTTTSQAEADRNAGRKLRKDRERAAKERKKAERRCRANPEDCGQGRDYRTGDY